MTDNGLRRLKYRAGLLCSASVTVLITLGAPGGAYAQTADGATGASLTDDNGSSEIVVTATRVKRNGYEAPTPTSVIGEAELATKAPANIADFVNELPSLAGSVTPTTSTGAISAGTSGINALNLRNLGENRTLVLLDGQRVGASTLTGWVDVNQFPQALVKRVDVVTGGASADWGSDAVAGVVNFVLDKDFTGLKGEAQGGLTTYGDNGSYKLSMAAGTGFSNGRGHILFSAEDEHSDGITGVPRGWYNGSKLFFNPNYKPGNGQPQLLTSAGVGFATAAPGGIITSGPLKGTYFGPGGTPQQFTYGPLVSAPFMQGGQWQYADLATTGDLAPELSRYNLFFRTSYDVTDHLEVFGQASYSDATSREGAVNQFNFANLTMQSDNAFIPAGVASQLKAQNISSFTLGTLNQDLGPIVAKTDRSSWRGVVGASGDFNALGSNWTWDSYGQRTHNDIYSEADVSITANYKAAIDSVRNASGTIVCRSTLTNPSNGCVPFDIFGTGVNNQAAINYVLGGAWGRTGLTEDVVAANLRGNPFYDWAGPISIATGIEHRREAVGGENDPLSSTNSYFAGNYHASHGSYDVTEGYFETVVPLAKNQVLAKSLDLNGAVRATDYSTSGYVTTWKVGLTYSPFDDLTFRATRSRDIRAPNLSELFQAGQTSTVSLTDPLRGNSSSTAFQVTEGNLNLQPEMADTTGVGAVVKPRILPGFEASVDYYNIDINHAIQTVSAQTLINECYAGNPGLCSAISRNAAGAISSVTVQPINLAEQIARGLDIEASYRRKNLGEILPFLDGNLTVRFLATHYLENLTNNGINPPTNTVGTNGENGTTAGVSPALPHWRYLATVGWDRGPLAVNVTARGVSDGVINTSYLQCSSNCPASTASNMTINNNHVPGAIYFDTTVNYQLPYDFQSEVYVSVDNIANTSPPQVPYGTSIGAAPLSVSPSLYDVLGRTFRMGFRFEM